jgi:hypothetical protein
MVWASLAGCIGSMVTVRQQCVDGIRSPYVIHAARILGSQDTRPRKRLCNAVVYRQ